MLLQILSYDETDDLIVDVGRDYDTHPGKKLL